MKSRVLKFFALVVLFVSTWQKVHQIFCCLKHECCDRRFVIVVNCRFAGTTSTNKNGTVRFCDKCFHSYFRRCRRLKCMLIIHVKKGLSAAMTWPCMHLDQEWHPWQHLSNPAFLCTQTLAEMQGNRKLNEEAQFIFTIVSGGMLEELLPQKWGVPRGLCIHEKKNCLFHGPEAQQQWTYLSYAWVKVSEWRDKEGSSQHKQMRCNKLLLGTQKRD